jgi:hypothetical protein
MATEAMTVDTLSPARAALDQARARLAAARQRVADAEAERIDLHAEAETDARTAADSEDEVAALRRRRRAREDRLAELEDECPAKTRDGQLPRFPDGTVRYGALRLGVLRSERREAQAVREVLAELVPSAAWGAAAVADFDEAAGRLLAKARELIEVEAEYSALIELDTGPRNTISRANHALSADPGDAPVSMDALSGLSAVAAAWGGTGTVEWLLLGLAQRLVGLYEPAKRAAVDATRAQLVAALS